VTSNPGHRGYLSIILQLCRAASDPSLGIMVILRYDCLVQPCEGECRAGDVMVGGDCVWAELTHPCPGGARLLAQQCQGSCATGFTTVRSQHHSADSCLPLDRTQLCRDQRILAGQRCESFISSWCKIC